MPNGSKRNKKIHKILVHKNTQNHKVPVNSKTQNIKLNSEEETKLYIAHQSDH